MQEIYERRHVGACRNTATAGPRSRSCLPGRTDNNVKNFWNFSIKKKASSGKLVNTYLQQGKTLQWLLSQPEAVSPQAPPAQSRLPSGFVAASPAASEQPLKRQRSLSAVPGVATLPCGARCRLPQPLPAQRLDIADEVAQLPCMITHSHQFLAAGWRHHTILNL